MSIEYICLNYKQFLCEFYLTLSTSIKLYNLYVINQWTKNWSDVMFFERKVYSLYPHVAHILST